MTWGWADTADLPDAIAYLETDSANAMFPLVNLRDHGLVGASEDQGHERAVRMAVRREAGRITGLVCLARGGFLNPVRPDLTVDEGLIDLLAGQKVSGIVGPTAPARMLQQRLSLMDGLQHDADEPQFALDLARLQIPPGPGPLVGFADIPKDLLIRWRADYQIGTLGVPETQAEQRAREEIAEYTARDSHRVLLRDGAPVAMTGFNARYADQVQIGGVYTPPELRGQGLARRALALHLSEARDEGVARAVLFAATDSAAAAYVAVGFEKIGSFSLILYDAPQEARPCP